jgi:hypothetical protein
MAHEVQNKHGWKIIEKTQIEFSRTFRQTAFSLWCVHQTSVKNQQNAIFFQNVTSKFGQTALSCSFLNIALLYIQ